MPNSSVCVNGESLRSHSDQDTLMPQAHTLGVTKEQQESCDTPPSFSADVPRDHVSRLVKHDEEIAKEAAQKLGDGEDAARAQYEVVDIVENRPSYAQCSIPATNLPQRR